MNISYDGPAQEAVAYAAPGPQGRIIFVEDEARRHLEVLFEWWDGATSYVLVTYGRGQGGPKQDRQWAQRSYEWPAQVPALMEHVAGAVERGTNVYVAPNLFTGNIVTPSGMARGGDEHLRSEVRCVHLDLDGDHDADAIDRLREAGALLVGSGSAGHAHGYVLLPTAVDRADQRRWAERIKRSLGCSRLLAPSDVLRLAGTGNFKTTNGGGTPVSILTPAADGQVSPDALQALADDGSERVVPIGVARGRPVGGVYSRSHAAYQLWCFLWEEGYEPQEAYFRALAAAGDEDDLYHRSASAAVAKYGDGDDLLHDAERSMQRRADKATGIEVKMRADERARRQREGLV